MSVFEFIPPCCPIPAKTGPIGDDWQHEVKFDGYRVQVHKTGKDVTIYSRNGLELPARSVILDGEIVASGRSGVPNFARLHLCNVAANA